MTPEIRAAADLDMEADLIKEFVAESREGLDRLDEDLLALEQDPRNPDTLGRVFRTIHTIKGTCGFFGFAALESMSHVGENLLSRMRDGRLVLDARITTALLQLVDALRETLDEIEATGGEGHADRAPLIALLERLAGGGAGLPDVAPAPPPGSTGPAASGASVPPGPPATATGPEAFDAGGDAPRAAGEHRQAAPDSSLRVDVSVVDSLMDLVGELVLARNQILQVAAAHADAGLLKATQRLDQVTSKLRHEVMKARMQPIGTVWSKLPRVVRDLASQCGKQVRIQMTGQSTELDRTIIEAIKDPLTHAIRNAVDHGIELPEVRAGCGKPTEGTLRLRAWHESGRVNIEIADDGAGVDAGRVRTRAVQRGLLTFEQAQQLTDDDAVRLIFLPGFSTAEAVTHVSGRGVGMDVVKTNVEKVGGSVDVRSRPGGGTTLRITIPLTLAIIPALTVTSAGQRFALPQVSVLELLRLDAAEAEGGFARIGQACFHRLRGALLPVVVLSELLGLGESRQRDAVHLVVVEADSRRFGLVVDAIGDAGEIVVKPLGRPLAGLDIFAGATIMGDGRVALILDVPGLAGRAAIGSGPAERTAAATSPAVRDDVAPDKDGLLLVSVSGADVSAIPLSMVARLEELPRVRVERSAAGDVVLYRNGILPLIDLPGYLGSPLDPPPPVMQVVVFSENGRSAGLVVARILDIVRGPVAVRGRAGRRGLLGSAVVGQRVTDLLDVHAAIRASLPGFFDVEAA